MVKIITEKPHMEGNLVRRVFYDRSRKVECEIQYVEKMKQFFYVSI
jgi:hypothetical protein